MRLGSSANGRFIIREEFGRALVRSGAPVRPHSAGLKEAQTLYAERDSSWARDSVKPPTAHLRSMVGRAADGRGSGGPPTDDIWRMQPLRCFAHVWYGRTGDINDAIEIGVNHRLEPLRAQLLERRNIRCEPGVINANHVETPKRVKCSPAHGGLSGALIRHVKRNRAGRARRIYLPSHPVVSGSRAVGD